MATQFVSARGIWYQRGMSIVVEQLSCLTGDGVTLAVRRVRDDNVPTQGPLVMQHGLGSNGALFDVPDHSLARYLAQAGFDCFISELRGAGQSQVMRSPFGLDEYIEYDIPAIIENVCRWSGSDRLKWIGHSMGGILLMFYALEVPNLPVERFVAIASALDYKPGNSVFRKLIPLRPLAGNWLKWVHFGHQSRLNAPVAGTGPAFPPERMNFWRSNVDVGIMRKVLRDGYNSIPMRLFDDLGSTFQPRGFARKSGDIVYLDRVGSFAVPTLLVMGSKDVQATDAAVERTAELLASAPELEVLKVGKPYGQVDDYGHADLIVGRNAEHDVWAPVLAFLQQRYQASAGAA